MSWGDPWVQAFQGISRAAENYGAIKYSEQKEELAKKAREEAERLAKENEVVWKGFSPEGDYMEMTRGQAMGGGKLPAFELDRQKAEQARLQAEAEAKEREQQAKIGSYESRAAADQARGQASLSRAALDDAKRTRPQDFRSQGGRGSGLAKPSPTASEEVIKSIREAAQRMLTQKDADSVKIKAQLESMYPPELVAKALGTYREPSVMSTDTLFGTNPTVDDLLGSYLSK